MDNPTVVMGWLLTGCAVMFAVAFGLGDTLTLVTVAFVAGWSLRGAFTYVVARFPDEPSQDDQAV